MPMCASFGCTNSVLWRGDMCWACSQRQSMEDGSLFKSLDVTGELPRTTYICTELGCTNTVSEFGGKCWTCEQKESTSSLLKDLSVNVEAPAYTCTRLGCTNTVSEFGGKCWICEQKESTSSLLKDLSVNVEAPAYTCTRLGCTNTVSEFGGKCWTCEQKESTSSLLRDLSVNVEAPAYTCTRLGCTNTVSELGKKCWSCEQEESAGSLLKKLNVNVEALKASYTCTDSYTCTELGCTNTVSEFGEKCWSCKQKESTSSLLRSLNLNIEPQETSSFRCSGLGCTNSVSGFGEECWSCKSKDLATEFRGYQPKVDSYFDRAGRVKSQDYLGIAEDAAMVLSAVQDSDCTMGLDIDVVDVANFVASRWVDSIARQDGKDTRSVKYKVAKTAAGTVVGLGTALAGLGPFGILLGGVLGMLIGASAEYPDED